MFKDTCMKIFIHILLKEINLNDKESVLAPIDEEEDITDQTVHCIDEDELNNVTFKEGSIKTGKNQIIMSIHEKETEFKNYLGTLNKGS